MNVALVSVPRACVLHHQATLDVGQCWGEARNRKAGGNGAFWAVTPLGLLTNQCPRHRPWSKCLPGPWRDKASHSSPLMIYAPSCSAPCKAFSLNSLPFSRTAAARICGNQATATPPTRPARLPQTWLPRPKLPLPSKLPLLP